MRKVLFEEIAVHPRHDWPNIVFAFDRYLLSYACDNGACPNPLDAYAISSFESPRSELLIQFILFVARALQAIETASLDYWDYLHGPSSGGSQHFSFEDAPIKGPLPPHMASVIGSKGER